MAPISAGVLHEACLDLMRATNSLHKSHVKFSYTTAFVVQTCLSLFLFRRPLQHQIAQTALFELDKDGFLRRPLFSAKSPQVTPSEGPSSTTGVIPRQALCPVGKCSSFLVMHRTARLSCLRFSIRLPTGILGVRDFCWPFRGRKAEIGSKVICQ